MRRLRSSDTVLQRVLQNTESGPAQHALAPTVVQKQPRVAIFQAEWHMHSNVEHLACALRDAGFAVDVFLYHVSLTFAGAALGTSPGVRLYVLDEPTSGQTGAASAETTPSLASPGLRKRVACMLPLPVRKMLRAGYEEAKIRRLLPHGPGLPWHIIEETHRIMSGASYVALIGVEKCGLAWAGHMSTRFPAPLIYFSLELYTRDHFYYKGSYHRLLKTIEESIHKRCWATIVQDEKRAAILLRDNGVRGDMKLLYAPISRRGPPDPTRSSYLQHHLGLTAGHTLVLIHGVISHHRLSPQLAAVAQHFAEDWRLVFHGFDENSVIDEMRAIDEKGRICLSLQILPQSQEPELARSAHIGLVIYGNTTDNDRLTAFSSAKIALYLQCGLPVIAFRYPGYDHIESEGCGVLINDLDEIPSAVEQILESYDAYRAHAFECFTKHYNFEKNYAKVVEALKEVSHADSAHRSAAVDA